MTHKQVNSTVKIVYAIAAIMVLAGAIFKLEHYPNGLYISITGFILGTATTTFEIIRLKKKNKSLEEQLDKKD